MRIGLILSMLVQYSGLILMIMILMKNPQEIEQVIARIGSTMK